MSEDGNEAGITLRVLMHKDGRTTLEVKFEHFRNLEQFEPSRGAQGMPEESLGSRSLSRAVSTDQETALSLELLSEEWTSSAIAFLEIVPEFASRNLFEVSSDVGRRIIDLARPHSIDRMENVAEESCIVHEFRFSPERFDIVSKAIGKSTQAFRAVRVMSHAALGALVSEYETLISNLLRVIAKRDAGFLISMADQISVRDLERYSTYADFFEALIEDKLVSLSQSKSHHEMLLWIGEKFKVNLTSNRQLIAEFVEICQRRHAIAHAGGIANKKYIDSCTQAQVPANLIVPLGEELSVSRKYLRRATARVYQVGFFTLHLLWQKVLAEYSDRSRSAVLKASHDFLESDLTKMAERVCNFGLFGEEKMPLRLRRYLTINLAQSYLFSEDISNEKSEDVACVLKRCDWSDASPTVLLALACLRREYEDLYRLCARAKDDGVTSGQAHTWSIFREIRDREEFRSVFELN